MSEPGPILPAPDPVEPKPKRTRKKAEPKPDVPPIDPPVDIYDNREYRRSTPETRTERTSRLRREAKADWHEQLKEIITYGMFALLLGAVTFACIFVVVLPIPVYSSETLKLVSVLLTAIVSGGSSFFAGRAAGRSKPS